MNEQLISIVMPVKNAGLYLLDCLNSIVNQTESNWELIAVDDYSTDNSYEILQSFDLKFEQIKVLRNDKVGLILALQLAYKHTNGKLIHRMDADDLMHPEKLEHLKQLLIKSGKGSIATSKVKYFAEGIVSDGFLKYEEWLNRLCDNNSQWSEIYKECVIASPNWLIYREDFEKCGGFNSELYPEDYDLVFRFYQNKLKVKSIDSQLHLWRDHSERASRNDPNYHQNMLFELKTHYFLKLERDNNRPLVLWGAGPKGKIMAKFLNERNALYTWVSNNPNKHGKEIYSQIMESFESILAKDQPQIIITVAQKNTKDEIVDFLESKGLRSYKDYWFFR